MRQETIGNDGLIGLGILALMVVALVAGEVHANLDAAGEIARPEAPPRVLIQLPYDPRSEEIEGAIRELSVFPMAIEQLDLGWASDEKIFEEYRRTDF